MSRNLEAYELFSNISTIYENRLSLPLVSKYKYSMIVPTYYPEFEIPLVALTGFSEVISSVLTMQDLPKELVFGLKDNNVASDRKTASAALPRILTKNVDMGLIRFTCKDKEGEDVTYFASRGLLLNNHKSPVMVASILLTVNYSGDTATFKAARPLVRLDPSFWLSYSNDAVGKNLIKILKTSFDHITLDIPTGTGKSLYCNDHIGILIDEIPFGIKIVKTPNCNTSLEELKDVAFGYFDRE